MGRRSLSAAFAEVVREQRAKRGVSQEDLAHDADLHRTYVGLIERGLRNPTIEVGHCAGPRVGHDPLRPDSTSGETARTDVALDRQRGGDLTADSTAQQSPQRRWGARGLDVSLLRWAN